MGQLIDPAHTFPASGELGDNVLARGCSSPLPMSGAAEESGGDGEDR